MSAIWDTIRASHVPILTSTLVALVAALFATCGSLDGIGDSLFESQGLDLIRFALPLTFSRFAVPAKPSEAAAVRGVAATTLGIIALSNLHLRSVGKLQSFALLLSCQAASYLVFLEIWSTWIQALLAASVGGCLVGIIIASCYWEYLLKAILCIIVGFCARQLAKWLKCPAVDWITAAASLVGGLFMPSFLMLLLHFLLPVNEIAAAYNAVAEFIGNDRLGSASMEMMIITANIQIPLGYLGIAYLRYMQERQNALLTVDAGEHALSARGYVCKVRRWLLVICLPYVLQRTVMSSVQSYTFERFRHWTERSLRLHGLFPDEGERGTLLRAVALSNFTVEQYADAINGAVEMSFGIVSKKLFSLPKLLLVPGILATRPWLLTAVLPASVALDVSKAWLTAQLTQRIESMHRELMELANRRRRMELHDMKYEELIQRGQAGYFVQRKWRELGNQIEDRGMRMRALESLRNFINDIYSQQILGPGIECTLAFLLEVGYLKNVDIYLYVAVLEQAIDTLLTRHREQATLANMQTKVGLVTDFAIHLGNVKNKGRPECIINKSSDDLHIKQMEYVRGQTRVGILDLKLAVGQVIAVTGKNGCGKSTALGLLACCGSQSASLPAGAELLPPGALIELPSDDVVEIAQQFYCPLFTSPMSWLLAHVQGSHDFERQAMQLLEEFGLLTREERYEQNSSVDVQKGFIANELHLVKEDWYSELSGGERCKVEFIRKVFLRPQCPKVLLIDETFAPLDPISRQLVKTKLKKFCSKSLLLVVYHGEESSSSDDFFDDNLYFHNGTASLIGLH